MKQQHGVCDHAMGSILADSSLSHMARVQGSVGCLQRGLGVKQQTYLTRGALIEAQYTDSKTKCTGCNCGPSGCNEAQCKKQQVCKADDNLKAHTLFSNMGGVSNVNLQGAKCYEQRINTVTGSEGYRDGKVVKIKTAAYDSDTEIVHAETECGHKANDKNFYLAAGEDEDSRGWEKHCAATATPKFLWYESGSCENIHEPMECKSFTKVDCDNHKIVKEERLCDSSNDIAAIAANEAGFCTCKKGNETVVQPFMFMCGQHKPTSCQDYCQAKNPLPGVTDVVMVSSADMNGDDDDANRRNLACPLGYDPVNPLIKSAVGTGVTPISNDLNEGRDAENWPKLMLCQSNALTAK